jgi:pre-mRNA branch site protein p14
VKNLPFKINNVELYDIFGKYGGIRQIRLGNTASTRGTAYVVYDDVYDAKSAFDHLSGFSVAGRYLVCSFYKQSKLDERLRAKKDEQDTKVE